MKYRFPKKLVLLFFVMLLCICWMVLQRKIEIIGDYPVKVIESLSLVIGAVVATAITAKIVINSKKSK